MKTALNFLLLVSLSAVLLSACTSPQEPAPSAALPQEPQPTSPPPTAVPVEPTVSPTQVISTSTLPPTEESAPAGLTTEQLAEAKAVLNTNCATCHSTARIASAQKDLAGWKANINRMIGKGAILTSDQAELIAIYLAEGNNP